MYPRWVRAARSASLNSGANNTFSRCQPWSCRCSLGSKNASTCFSNFPSAVPSCADEVLEFIEDYDPSCPTQFTDGSGHGYEVDDGGGELSYVFEIGFTETAAKGR